MADTFLPTCQSNLVLSVTVVRKIDRLFERWPSWHGRYDPIGTRPSAASCNTGTVNWVTPSRIKWKSDILISSILLAAEASAQFVESKKSYFGTYAKTRAI